jgi:pilus assembly protein Flp/PilA
MLKYLMAVLNDEEGASLVEYALIVSLIAVVCIVAVTALGSKANVALNTAANAF